MGSGVPDVDIDGRVQGTRRVRQNNLWRLVRD